MKLTNVLLLSGSVAFLIIGIHQMMVLGITHAYWIIMLSVVLLFLYQLRKRKQ